MRRGEERNQEHSLRDLTATESRPVELVNLEAMNSACVP